MLLRKFKFTFMLALFVLALGLAGCSDDEPTTQAEEEPEAKSEEKSEYPTRPIEIIAGGGSGGGTDTYSRAVARELSDILGVPVNVVNKPGAGGTLASHELAALPSDGYSILPTNSDFQNNIASEKTPNFLDEFDALARIHVDTYSLLVKSGSEYADIDTLISEAKKNPGEIVIGGTGTDGLDEMTVEKFEKEAGIELNYTSYEDTGKMQAAVLGGHIDLMIEEIGPSFALIDGGELEISLILTDSNLAEFPDVPSAGEKGFDVTGGMERGFMIHKDAPEEVKEILKDALKEVANAERYKEFAESNFYHLKDGWLDAEEYTKDLERQIEEISSK